jgi:hypothetical protein
MRTKASLTPPESPSQSPRATSQGTRQANRKAAQDQAARDQEAFTEQLKKRSKPPPLPNIVTMGPPNDNLEPPSKELAEIALKYDMNAGDVQNIISAKNIKTHKQLTAYLERRAEEANRGTEMKEVSSVDPLGGIALKRGGKNKRTRKLNRHASQHIRHSIRLRRQRKIKVHKLTKK